MEDAEQRQLRQFALGAVIVVLLFALFRMPHGFYVFVRVVVCTACIYLVASPGLTGTSKNIFRVLLAVVAIFYNPFVPTHLRRDTWEWVNLGSALIFGVYLLHVTGGFSRVVRQVPGAAWKDLSAPHPGGEGAWLYAKDTQGAFDYYCRYLDSTMKQGHAIPAIVAEYEPIEDTAALVVLKVISKEGGLEVPLDVPLSLPIQKGDLVLFCVMAHIPELEMLTREIPLESRKYFGHMGSSWIGFIGAKLTLAWNFRTGEFGIERKFRLEEASTPSFLHTIQKMRS